MTPQLDSIGNFKRTHYCGTLNETHIGNDVALCGWVNKRRDHGGLVFVDLRDRSGVVQVVFNPEIDKATHARSHELRNEDVIGVVGKVSARQEEMYNPNIATGTVEVLCSRVLIFSKAKTPPFYIKDDVEIDEKLRLTYRYLDLRRPKMQKYLFFRHRVCQSVRTFMDRAGFIEVETPMLTKSTPEGARDFLVPSRIQKESFYALPQSPQLFKQLLMVSGIDKYFQIVKCFRDEDLRADRQPEFTQIDVEMSFINRDGLIATIEDMVSHVFKETLSVELPRPFLRMTYEEAMNKYGSDKPDLRFELEIRDLNDIVENSEFHVFSETVKGGGYVKALNVPGAGKIFSRHEIDQLPKFAKKMGAKGLFWIVLTEDGIKSSLSKFLPETTKKAIFDRLSARPGDLVLIIADDFETVCRTMGALRLKMAEKLELLPEREIKPEKATVDDYKVLWVTDFPLFEYSSTEKRYKAVHHPFTSPNPSDIGLLDTEEFHRARANAYDLVINGVEVGGGSIRIYQPDLQNKIFKILGFSQQEIEEKFGFLLKAFSYGVPPHGGIALGLARLIMAMLNIKWIRNIIAFPKTQSGSCLLTGAPGPIDDEQMKLLGLRKR